MLFHKYLEAYFLNKELSQSVNKSITTFIYFYIVILPLLSYFVSVNIKGVLNALLIIGAAIMWGLKGGIPAAAWSSAIITLHYLLPITFPTYALFTQLFMYFVIAILVGTSIDIYRWQRRTLQKEASKRKKIESALQETKEKLEAIIKASPVAIISLDTKGKVISWNEAAEELYCLSNQEALEQFHPIIPEDKQNEFRTLFQRVIQGELFKELEITHQRKDGTHIYTRLSAAPLRDSDGSVIGIMAVADDITKRKLAEKKLTYEKKKFEALFNNSPEAIVTFDYMYEITDINAQFSSTFGHTLKEINGNYLDELLNIDISSEKAKNFYKELFQGNASMIEWMCHHKEGKPISVITKGIPVVINNKIESYFVVFTDISKLKHNEERLKYLSFNDALTGLFNRRYFEEEICRLQKSKTHPISFIVADINGLKTVNDTLGHNMGDKLIITCANILQKSVRKKDIVSRIGGDEFAIIMPQTNQNTVALIKKRIIDNIIKLKEENLIIHLSVSIGFSTTKNNEQPLLEIFKKADQNMYKEKTSKKNVLNSLISPSKLENLLYIFGHTNKLIQLANKLGVEANLTHEQLNTLILFTKVHDIGKIGICKRIIFKAGKLNKKGCEEIRRHPEIGQNIANSYHDLQHITNSYHDLQHIANSNLILYHHERWDGKGYPIGLKEEEIPIECRILSIVDAFDAMTSNNRWYKKPVSAEEAVKEICRCSGTQFDPMLVKKFVTIID